MSDFFLSSPLCWNVSLEEMFRFVYENKMGGIEIFAQHWFLQNYTLKEYERVVQLYPLNIIVHSSSWDLNLASLNEGIRRTSVEEVKKSVDLAEHLKAKEVTVHPGRRSVNFDLVNYEKTMYQSFQEILNYAKKKKVKISLEIMEEIPKEFITSVKAMIDVVGDLKEEFCYTLDIAHCNNEKILLSFLEAGLVFSKFHISNRQGKKLHTPLDVGEYCFFEILPLLEKYNIPFVIEGFDPGNTFELAKRNINYIKLYEEKKNEEKNARNLYSRVLLSEPCCL